MDGVPKTGLLFLVRLSFWDWLVAVITADSVWGPPEGTPTISPSNNLLLVISLFQRPQGMKKRTGGRG